MLDLFHIAKPQGCDIQTFMGNSGVQTKKSWTKPRGVSHVYMMIIGGGGNGDGTTGGGSGAVTVWYGAAQHVPDVLIAVTGAAQGTSSVQHNRSTGQSNLLSAIGGNGPIGGNATTANQFAASGFYQSTAGQDGSSGTLSGSPTTFLSGGGNGTMTANYGYTASAASVDKSGYFLMQPIIVGVGASASRIGGLGCGGGSSNALGGGGFVLIASW